MRAVVASLVVRNEASFPSGTKSDNLFGTEFRQAKTFDSKNVLEDRLLAELQVAVAASGS